jgi:hypothetical protein
LERKHFAAVSLRNNGKLVADLTKMAQRSELTDTCSSCHWNLRPRSACRSSNVTARKSGALLFDNAVPR